MFATFMRSTFAGTLCVPAPAPGSYLPFAASLVPSAMHNQENILCSAGQLGEGVRGGGQMPLNG